MAIGGRMMNQEEEIRSKKQEEEEDDNDDHENDMVMPGFRFHPTEEELVEFYLRRKVEGKRFNVQLITFLDLYRYDPWELPALAAIGEKEWFFYVPRDRKYRNGDRPNRVTTSGYWKATGADRMIRTDNFRSIGLKKTLVFYSGKAPKGIRSSWIMNEYRLPQHETERLQKAEISLCRVYKRTGVEDYPSFPRSLQTTKITSSRPSNHHYKQHLHNSSSLIHSFEGQSSRHTDDYNLSYHTILTALQPSTAVLPPQTVSSTIFPNSVDDLHRIISTQQAPDNRQPNQLFNIHNYHNFSSNCSPNLPANNLLPPPQPRLPELQQQLHSSQAVVALNNLPEAVQVAFPDRIWEWNSISSEGSKDFTNPFK